MTLEPAGGTTAAGLFSNSPHSESSDDFADALSQGHRSSSSATAASFHTAPSAPVDNSSGSEEEVQRSSRGRRRGAGLAGVLGSPSPLRQSRFARFVSSAAAVTGLNAGSSTAQQEEGLAREQASRLGGKGGGQSEVTDATAGELPVHNNISKTQSLLNTMTCVCGFLLMKMHDSLCLTLLQRRSAPALTPQDPHS